MLQWLKRQIVMINKNLLPIAKYGFTKILSFLGLLLILLILDCELLSFISFVIVLILVYTYRNPEREVSVFEKNSILSPVDAKVTAIEELQNDKYAYKIVLDSRLSDVAILRAPISAKIVQSDVQYGARLSRDNKLADLLNENALIVFEDENDNKISITHCLKQSFEDIILDVNTKTSVGQGSRYGFMLNGETTIYLPDNFRANINVGDELKASQSLIGYFS